VFIFHQLEADDVGPEVQRLVLVFDAEHDLIDTCDQIRLLRSLSGITAPLRSNSMTLRPRASGGFLFNTLLDEAAHRRLQLVDNVAARKNPRPRRFLGGGV
jgi:hypothetical protein